MYFLGVTGCHLWRGELWFWTRSVGATEQSLKVLEFTPS